MGPNNQWKGIAEANKWQNNRILEDWVRTLERNPVFNDGKTLACIVNVLYMSFFKDSWKYDENLLKDLLNNWDNTKYTIQQLEEFSQRLNEIKLARLTDKVTLLERLEKTYKETYSNDNLSDDNRGKVSIRLNKSINDKIGSVLSIRSKQRLQEKKTASDLTQIMQ